MYKISAALPPPRAGIRPDCGSISRSRRSSSSRCSTVAGSPCDVSCRGPISPGFFRRAATGAADPGAPRAMDDSCGTAAPRSEEHTSELQSQSNLVCRLLLEKKKKENNQHHGTHHDPPTAAYP